MALVQEPEVQLAQRLASNEKPIRTKAVKKLRKYISVRSQKATGGFTSDELLKLWKGLFYCLWMQDKPLLQEELSNQISSLLHSFHNTDGQLLYLETFLQTFKREWTGIDRLRMDKFYQLVRFMFRQTFEILKKSDWDSSLISRFLELLTAQLLHSSSAAPMGLQFHVLDLYMTELAVVGSAELTAAQNLTFIEPFCKTAARTKDQILFRALCNSIFSTIIDQAPFAIEDLMKEIKGAQASDSDSGQASEGDEDEQPRQKTQSKANKKTDSGRLVNGKKSHIEDEEDEDEDDDDEDDELHHLDDTDAEMQCNEDVGPVLQFDYGALADKLLALSSRSNTPSHNRKRLYKIIKVLRDLSEGIFPQDDYPEEVSTDEDDDMFGSRKRVKRRFDEMEGDDEEEGGPKSKKSKGKKKDPSSTKKNTKSEKDGSEPADVTASDENKKKKKKRKKKKKAKQGGGEDMKETEGKQIISSIKVTEASTENVLVSEVSKLPSVTVTEEASQSQPSTVEAVEAGEQQTPGTQENGTPEGTTQTETPPEEDLSQSGKRKKKKKDSGCQGAGEEISETQTPISSIKVTDGQTETLLLSEVNKPPSVSVTPETSQSQPSVVEVIEPAEQQTPVTQEDGTSEGTTPAEEDATQPGKKKRKKKKKKSEQGEGEEIKETQTSISSVGVTSTEGTSQSQPSPVEADDAGEQQTPVTPEEATADGTAQQDTPPEEGATQSGKKKKKKKAEVESQGEVSEDVAVPPEKSFEATTPGKKKKKKDLKKKSEKTEAAAVAGDDATTAEATETSTTTPAKKRSKKTNLKAEADEKAPQETPVVKKENQAAEKKTKGYQMPEEDVDKSTTTPAKKKKPKNKLKSTEEEDGALPQQVVEADSNQTPKKKRKIPVVFEFEADEIEAAKASNGVAQEATAAKKAKVGADAETPDIPLSTKKSPKKVKNRMGTPQSFITFQDKTTVPTPLFCKTKGSPSTPLSSKKKCLTPKSGSKKVTFGLKNNKTAEFKKTDRSLLLSPDGSSRVPFDPEQKPKCGVLKSPPTPAVRKTPTTKKKSCSTPKSTPKRRPSAADFF
ncbi:ribosomal RNA processing protein 1 homolog B isoform X2 [Sphaeramia orbicularis]|uniref:ribosomal RNA processing protein 1 homolog B isoform X2 n=1 Tax=Sphaeramia orbicularis TaxID=375764 RepID=UPI00118084B3|nr:ribosomal RNA processing protein 1 homolog B-like isoform X2 [Sphaeramia orbicularis]